MSGRSKKMHPHQHRVSITTQTSITWFPTSHISISSHSVAKWRKHVLFVHASATDDKLFIAITSPYPFHSHSQHTTTHEVQYEWIKIAWIWIEGGTSIFIREIHSYADVCITKQKLSHRSCPSDVNHTRYAFAFLLILNDIREKKECLTLLIDVS